MNSMANLWLPAFSMPGSGGRAALVDFRRRAPESLRGWSVACIDLSNFRLLNKLLGPEGGDLILQVVGATLRDDGRHHWFHISGDVWIGVCERRDPRLMERQFNELRLKLREMWVLHSRSRSASTRCSAWRPARSSRMQSTARKVRAGRQSWPAGACRWWIQ